MGICTHAHPCPLFCIPLSAEHLASVQIVNWLAQFKPKQLSKQQLVKPILESLCQLCAEPEPEDHDQDDQLSANKFASQVRHQLCAALCCLL